MPHKEYTPAKVEVRVSRIAIGKTEVNQLAWCTKFITEEKEDGRFTVLMQLDLIPYAVVAEGDGWGECLAGVGPFQTRKAEIRADDNTIVEVTDDPNDPHFGRILAIKHLSTPEEWAAADTQFPGQVMYQGQFMSYLRDNLPQVLGQVQRYHIAQADAMGRFAR
jgi:hypothetical protein